MKCTEIVYIMVSYIQQKSENIDFKGLAEVINKLIFNNLHNPPPTKYFDIIINPLLKTTAQFGVGGRLWKYIK